MVYIFGDNFLSLNVNNSLLNNKQQDLMGKTGVSFTSSSINNHGLPADEFKKFNNVNDTDATNDGQFSASQAGKNFVKGLISPITSMFSSTKAFLTGAAMIGGSIALVAATGGAAAPLLVVAGVAMGTAQAAKGIYNIASARNGDDVEKAFFDIGGATSILGLSVLGAKGSLKQANIETESLSPFDATKKCFTSAGKFIEESTKVFKSGYYRVNWNNVIKKVTQPGFLRQYSKKFYEQGSQNFETSYKSLHDILPSEFRSSLQGRNKSEISIYEKLFKEIIINKKEPTDEGVIRDLVGDLIGARLTLEDVTPKNINKLVNALVSAIKKGDIQITEIENYRGPNNEYYFSPSQVEKIKQAAEQNNTKIDIVAKEKASGYTSVHLKIIPKDAEAIELQIRGKQIGEVCDWEHISYDLRHKKDLAKSNNKLGVLLSSVTKAIKGLSEEQYKKYGKYISDCYAYAQKTELGIEAQKPELPQGLDPVLSSESLQSLVTQIREFTPNRVKNPIVLPSSISVAGGANETILNS